MQPLNFKFAANLISALLSQRRFEAAVSITSKTASTALNVADPQDAVYVVSFFALRFLEAAALEDDASTSRSMTQPSNIERHTSTICLRSLHDMNTNVNMYVLASTIVFLDSWHACLMNDMQYTLFALNSAVEPRFFSCLQCAQFNFSEHRLCIFDHVCLSASVQGSVIAANLVDMAKRLIDAAATVATLDEGVRRLRNMLP